MMRLGDHEFRDFDTLDAAFGANHSDYPPMDSIPEVHRRGRSKGCDVASSLFFGGGKLSDHGLALKEGVDEARFYKTLRALLSSFAPKHEHKVATCGWLIEEYTAPAKSG